MDSDKDPKAFRTISEVAAEIGVAQHILRYWETKFPQLRPLQRAGNRRYYRPADVAIARTIHRLLTLEGYTVRGVHQMLAGGAVSEAEVAPARSGTPVAAAPPEPPQPSLTNSIPAADHALVSGLKAVREQLAAAIAD